MGTLQSSKVAAGVTILADHINKLWTDLVANHDHSSGKGGTVDHSDLSESAAMSGVSHTHGNIETHMNGVSGSFGDNPGGSLGVHGLASDVYVAGCALQQLTIVAGIAWGCAATGTLYYSPDGTESGGGAGRVTFTSTPVVICQVLGNTGNEFYPKDTVDVEPGTSTFEYHIAPGNKGTRTGLAFIAMGTV